MSGIRFAAVERSALAILLLTSVHHVYGAYVYDTPWRLHVVFLSALAGGAIIGAGAALRRSRTKIARAIAFWIFAAVTLAIPVGLIGVFEGGYNHLVKNALFFGGESPETMLRLFPPPVYELPNDLFFELTGILQFVSAMVTAYLLYRLVNERRAGFTLRGTSVPPRGLKPTAE